MEATCKVKYVRQSPYKIRFVADLIRGKKVLDAINILSSTNKKASHFLLKSINSAVANINYNDDANFENDELFIKKVLIDGGPTIKRFRPAAMGRAVPIKKRTSHITIVIESK
ncbi:MAG: 50S ribosomal protein L22 [Candidatus Marinimicrobia bacterium]|nr:50S ribosomal protein L22 [Candidatus Neomarinimicrobiota bacterium]|tara:strand:- start:33 stop:371 length:339 start_codon:yes stop_codon:yes gene_type:complete